MELRTDIIGQGKRLSGARTQEQRTGTPRSVRRVRPGRPYPLGATWDGRGVNFVLYSENATRVELCLFDSPDAERETVRFGDSIDVDASVGQTRRPAPGGAA